MSVSSSSWGLGMAAVCDCGTPWTFLLPFFTLWCFVVILRGDLLYVLPCAILFLCVFSPFSIAITSLGEERANLGAFRMFD